MSSALGSAGLGAHTFCARQHGQEECDSKGLPLTPHSINIVGRFQALLELNHRRLCAYLDIKRIRNGSHVMHCILWFHSDVLEPERLLVVSEWYEDSVERCIQCGQTYE